MESGTSNWYGYYCTLGCVASPRHSGTAAPLATFRADNYGGPAQTVASSLKKAQPYEVEAWVRTASNTTVIRFLLYYCGSFSGCQTVAGGSASVSGSWTRIAATFTPNWSGTLTDA